VEIETRIQGSREPLEVSDRRIAFTWGEESMSSSRNALPLLVFGTVAFLAGLFVGEGLRSPAPAPPPCRPSESGSGEPQEEALADQEVGRAGDRILSTDAPGEGGDPPLPAARVLSGLDWQQAALGLSGAPRDWKSLLAGLAADNDLPPHIKAAAIRKVGIWEKVGEVVPPSQISSMGLVRPSHLGEMRGTQPGRLVDSSGWAQLLASEFSLTSQDREALESKLWEFEEELTLNEKRILQVGFEVAQQKLLSRAKPAALAYYRLGGHLILIEESDDPRLAELAEMREEVTRRKSEWMECFRRNMGR
jgi:hypothetical protein